MLDVCLLGSGGMMPLMNRWLTSLLVRCNGKMILIDCGEGTQIPLRQAGWGFKAIDALLLTHYHADHVAGLPGFLLSLGNSDRTEPLTIIGPPGLYEVVKGLTVIAPELPYSIQLVEFSDSRSESILMGDFLIRSQPADHWMPCLCYSIEVSRAGKFDQEKAKSHHVPIKIWSRLQKGENIEIGGVLYTPQMVLGKPRKGLKLSYLTDSRPTPELLSFIGESDLLVCEGMYGEDSQLLKAIDKKHMLFSEAAQLAVKGHAKELWLTHFSPSMENPEDYLEKVRGVFENTRLGRTHLMKCLAFEE